MDVVETEKLKWMSQLPAPKPLAPGTAYPARFHFNGKIILVMINMCRPLYNNLTHTR
jgi:hypothetical protein